MLMKQPDSEYQQNKRASFWTSGDVVQTRPHSASTGTVWKGFTRSHFWSPYFRCPLLVCQHLVKKIVKKAHQPLHFLRVLRENNLQCKLLVDVHCSTIESVLAYCISVWYSSYTAANERALQRIINTAQRITGCSLPSL